MFTGVLYHFPPENARGLRFFFTVPIRNPFQTGRSRRRRGGLRACFPFCGGGGSEIAGRTRGRGSAPAFVFSLFQTGLWPGLHRGRGSYQSLNLPPSSNRPLAGAGRKHRGRGSHQSPNLSPSSNRPLAGAGRKHRERGSDESLNLPPSSNRPLAGAGAGGREYNVNFAGLVLYYIILYDII